MESNDIPCPPTMTCQPISSLKPPAKHQTTLFNFEELWQARTDRRLLLSCSRTVEMSLELGNERKDVWRCGKMIRWGGDKWKEGRPSACLAVVTVVTSSGNGTCSALLAVQTEHQNRLSVRYSVRAWEQGTRESGRNRLGSKIEIERFV